MSKHKQFLIGLPLVIIIYLVIVTTTEPGYLQSALKMINIFVVLLFVTRFDKWKAAFNKIRER